MTIAVISGLFIGILFGFALQRGRFCMNSAIRDLALLKDNTLMKAVGVAVLVQMVGFPLLSWAGLITLNPKPLFWGANLVGGIVFGIGMVLAGGCASGITYRVGEGVVAALSAVIGLAAAGIDHRHGLPQAGEEPSPDQHQDHGRRSQPYPGKYLRSAL